MHPIVEAEPPGSNLHQLAEALAQTLPATPCSHTYFNAFKKITLSPHVEQHQRGKQKSCSFLFSFQRKREVLQSDRSLNALTA